jgi:pimeloyl-ACP methyl ester carboxylesterase
MFHYPIVPFSIQVPLLMATTIYQAIACWVEDRQPPPGESIDIGGRRLHLYSAGTAIPNRPTIVLDHSLGGVEGYLLIEELAKLSRVCIYDRAGYGWSDGSPEPRTSQQIVVDLDKLLTTAGIEPPYILVGNSFGSYSVRLYAHLFPTKVVGMVLTDGLHEEAMLEMSWLLKALKFFFLSGFVMSTIGSALGIIRLLRVMKVFELLKPELRNFPPAALNLVKYSFCRPRHWITMSREIMNLDKCARQVSVAQDFGSMPIVSIKASSFFKPTFWTIFIPLTSANRLRNKIHLALSRLTTNYQQIDAQNSGHFVWTDQPELIVKGVQVILDHPARQEL